MTKRASGLRWVSACAAALSLSALALAPTAASAQTKRATENPGWEENDPPGDPSYRIYSNADVPGWDSTTGNIEIWDSGFQGVAAALGLRFAELNANRNGTTYQEFCLLNGDDVNWAFYHRKRSGGPATQNVTLELATTGGTVLQTLASNATTNTSSWDFLSGSTTFTGTSGVYRFQFSTTDPGSYGNFLDGLDINSIPVVEFAQPSTTSIEGEATPDLPKIAFSGRVTTPLQVQIQITGGAATLGTDYTTPSGTNTWNVTIPVGTYTATEFDIGLTVLADADAGSGEDIDFAIAASPNDYSFSSTQTCGAAPIQTAEHIITESSDLVTVKTLTSGNAAPIAGETVSFRIDASNQGPSTATSVSLTDLIPAGLTPTTGNGAVSQGSYDPGTGIWSVGTLANGDSAFITIEGVVDGGQGGATITNTTTAASGDQPDPTTDGDDLTESVTVTPSANLSITKTNTPGQNGEVDLPDDGVITGSNTTYTLVVTNNGPDIMTGAVVSDAVGSGLNCPASNPVTVSGDGVPAGSFTFSDLQAGITLGTLAVGEQTTLVYSCSVL